MSKCLVPSCTNPAGTMLIHWCSDCYDWLKEDKNRYWSENIEQSTARREAHLQSLKPKVLNCDINDCNCDADKRTFPAYWSARLCEVHLQEYSNAPENESGKFVERKNQELATPKTLPVAPCEYPECKEHADEHTHGCSARLCTSHYERWSDLSKGNIKEWIESEKEKMSKPIKVHIPALDCITEIPHGCIDWKAVESAPVFGDRGINWYSNQVKTVYVQPNTQGTLVVHHKLTDDKTFIQTYHFDKERSYRVDSLGENWDRHEDINVNISDTMNQRIQSIKNPAPKPIELLIQPLGTSVKVQGNGIKWTWFDNPEDLDDRDYETSFTEVTTLSVEPNSKGTLQVTHALKNGDLFNQFFNFGQTTTTTNRRDFLGKDVTGTYSDMNAPIPEDVMKKLKPTTKPSETSVPYAAPLSKPAHKCHVLSCDNDHNGMKNKYDAVICHEHDKQYAGEGYRYVYEYVNNLNAKEQEQSFKKYETEPVIVNLSDTLFSNDAAQLEKLRRRIGETMAAVQAAGIMSGLATREVTAGQLVGVHTVDTSKGFPRLTEDQIKSIESAIALQTPEGEYTFSNLRLDTCDESPNTLEATTTQETRPMTTTKDLYTVPVLKEDFTDAGVRLAGRQFTKLTRDSLAAVISGHLAPGDDSMRAKVGDFLKTDLGEALLQSLLSAGLSTLPESTGQIPALLSRELRVSSMAGAGDVFAVLLMKPLREVTSLFLAGVPKETAALEAQSQNVVKVNIPVSVNEEINR